MFLWILVAFVGVALLCTWLIIYPMLRQQGRVLVRLEAIEERLAAAGLVVPQETDDGRPAPPAGLAVGAAVPAFRLPDLADKTVALDDFRGRRVLLVHWSPDCGFCEQIAPDLAKLEGDLRRRNVETVLVSYGDNESNRRLAEEHGLNSPILLQDTSTQIDAFKTLGTPAAYLLDKEGRVAEPLALGADEVPLLARRAAARRRPRAERALSESRIEREGLKAGTPAPSFSLPDLAGRTVSLEQYRGRRLLLVFSDPHCEPCDVLARELAGRRRERQHNQLDVLMISRGEVEENRRKASEHAIEFPIVIQPGWRISKKYGIFATPVAFLVNENGVIEKEVARGTDQILAVADELPPVGLEVHLR